MELISQKILIGNTIIVKPMEDWGVISKPSDPLKS